MARDGSGTYTLPAGNPVSSGNVISSAWANTTLSDLGNEITGSLDRGGRGSMTAPIRTPDGSAATPSFSFTSEAATGFYRIGASHLGLSVNGSLTQEWQPGQSKLTGYLRVCDPVGGKSVTVGAVNGLAADYDFTLPTALPGSTLPVQLSAAGQLSTGTISGSQMANQTVTATQIANTTVTAAQIANATITSTQIANTTITNAQQNFGTPSASTDVAIKSYVDTARVLAWAKLSTGAAGAVTVTKGYNVASASYAGQSLTVNFTVAMADANYSVCVLPGVGNLVYHSVNLQTTSAVGFNQSSSGAVINFALGFVYYLTVIE